MNKHPLPPRPVEDVEDLDPIKAWFLGPQAENAKEFRELLENILELYKGWRTAFAPQDDSVIKAKDKHQNHEIYDTLRDNVTELVNRLKFNFPFFSPRYIGHMLSEQSIPAMLGYFAAMLRNANNVTPEAASVTVGLEIDVGEWISNMLGFPRETTWAHLCSGGTIANLEALWVARMIQFLPFCLKDICERLELKNVDLKTADGTPTSLLKAKNEELISLKASSILELADKVKDQHKRLHDEKLFESEIAKAKFNPHTRGLHSVYKELSLQPIILVSTAAHYSIKKVAQILGYGSDCVEEIPVDSQFRLNIDKLQERLTELSKEKSKYIAAVIGTVGTTEEGAVDPIHQIIEKRTSYEKNTNRSFWIHIDAAWGGYFAASFNSKSGEWKHPTGFRLIKHPWLENISEEERTVSWQNEIGWTKNQGNFIAEAYSAIHDADSVTIDPHKTGYIPYPAGMIVFREKRARQYVKQRAQYIDGELQLHDIDEEENIGSYIVEGSKPGAAAAACWLAHKTIPLNEEGHGLLMRECRLNALELTFYLSHHWRIFDELDNEYRKIHESRREAVHEPHHFTFVPIGLPDTNIVTFLAVPIESNFKTGYEARVNKINRDIQWLNDLNMYIHRRLSITVHKNRRQQIHDKDFFISHTVFNKSQYPVESIESWLSGIDVHIGEYVSKGLYLLRATVMNPFYGHFKDDKSMLFQFIKHLHAVAREVIEERWK